jgi:hypothetical protein
MRFILIFLLPFSCLSQKMFVENSQVSFFSSAPLEDISALSNKLEGVVDFSSGTFFFRIPINTFIFPSSLMQKHFNEKYMESETYTISSFKGNFKEKVNIYENQLLTIHADGVLNMHGINKEVSIKTDLLINNNVPKFSSEFNVILKDFSIKIPKIVRMNIADTILVNVSGNLVVM